MLMNRIADIFFTFGIVIIFLTFKTTDFIIVFDLVHFFVNDSIFFFGLILKKIDLISFFLLIGGMGKSAQLLFHT
jgi:NADH:ubiquinone oxidoreductase subunit 5 (subunit L)/multisubunit Na+/H+ antiporter MnhA subunit